MSDSAATSDVGALVATAASSYDFSKLTFQKAVTGLVETALASPDAGKPMSAQPHWIVCVNKFKTAYSRVNKPEAFMEKQPTQICLNSLTNRFSKPSMPGMPERLSFTFMREMPRERMHRKKRFTRKCWKVFVPAGVTS